MITRAENWREMQNPLVSIIVPVYQVEDFLNQCLKSLISQTYTHYEIILVDDGSKDSSSELCDSWSARYRNIFVIHQSNQGLSAARNTGMRSAKGEFLFFVDSDDTVDSHLLEICIDTIFRTSADVAIYRFDLIDESGTSLGPDKGDGSFPKFANALGKTSVKLLLNEYDSGCPTLSNYAWRFVARRKLYVDGDITFPVGKHFEDIATTYKVFGEADTVAFIQSSLYHYRQRENSILHSDHLLDTYQEGLRVLEMRASDIAQRFPSLKPKASSQILRWLINVSWENHIIRSGDKLQQEFVDFVDTSLVKYLHFEEFSKLPRKLKIKLILLMLRYGVGKKR